jgi:oligosaccharide repeat unit polymerase
MSLAARRVNGTQARKAGPRQQGSSVEVSAVMSPPWWLNPMIVFAALSMVGPILAVSLSSATFANYWLTPKYFGAPEFWITAAYVGAFLIGAAFIWARFRRRTGGTLEITGRQLDVLSLCGAWLFSLTLLGYAIWVVLGYTSGVGFGEVISALAQNAGTVFQVKQQTGTLSGLTTMTQFGPVVVAINAIISLSPARPRRWRSTAIVIVLAAMRSSLFAERLALIEVLLPILVIHFAVREGRSEKPRNRMLRVALPLIAPLLLAAYFGASEYSRSWGTYYEYTYQGGSYVAFVVQRLGGYYATASNNSALLVDNAQARLPLPYWTVEFLWHVPIVSSVATYQAATGQQEPSAVWPTTLSIDANPEFNNPGGILPAEADYGLVGGGVFWLALGLLVGLAYSRLRKGRVSSLLVYSVVFVGLLDSGREAYLGSGRFIPTFVAALIVGAVLQRAAKQSATRTSVVQTRLGAGGTA